LSRLTNRRRNATIGKLGNFPRTATNSGAILIYDIDLPERAAADGLRPGAAIFTVALLRYRDNHA
jgi:hypothetical protein